MGDAVGKHQGLRARGATQVRLDVHDRGYVEGADVALDSMTAVYACTVIADRLGDQMRPPRGNCRPNDFVSASSVARLVCRLRREGVAP